MALETREELLAGRYRRLETIGLGGMAKVYLAEDERLGRRVAIKRLHSDGPADAAARFVREARLGASLNHPNLVAIFDIASDVESVLIVMEYVEGDTLKDVLASGLMPIEDALDVIDDVAAALDHAHAHGVVHRDVKPANILIRRDGTAKLADMGIATAVEGTRITRSGTVLGTAAYMAPEQLDGQSAGPAADVYSLAVVTFEALTGRRAHSARSPMEIAHRVINGPPPDLRESRPDAPDGAAELLRRSMSRRPDDRPGSAGELVAELRRALASETRRSPADRALGSRAAPPAGGGAPRPRAHSARPRRPLPSWAPAALVLAAAVVIAALVLAAAGDGGGPADRSDRGNTPRVPAEEQEGREKAGRPRSSGSAGEARPASDGIRGGGGPAQSADPAALNDRGYRLMRAGRYDEATPILERAVNSYPRESKDLTYAYALYNLGRSLRLAGRADEAVPILERRLQIPDQTETVRRELEAARRAGG